MGFRLLPKSVTLNDLERHNGRYLLQQFGRFESQLGLRQSNTFGDILRGF